MVVLVPALRLQSTFCLRRRLWLAAAGALPFAHRVRADRPESIAFVNPGGVGGSADKIARVAADALAEILETKIVVSNMPGDGGTIGTRFIAGSKPDGYTLGLGISVPMIARQLLGPGTPYNPIEDFEWLAILGSYPNAVVVSARRPERSFAELMASARRAATPLNYGTYGIGSAGHMAGSFLRLEQSANVVHRPLEQPDDGYAQLASGQIDFLFDGVPNALEAVPIGGHRILAVTSAMRAPALPDTPAFGEMWPREYFVVWVGVVAPRGLSPEVYSRLAAAIGVMLLGSRYEQALRSTGMAYLGLNGAKARTFVDDEIVRTAKLIARLGAEGSRRP